MAAVILTLTGVITLANAAALDGDHMQDAAGADTVLTNQVVRKGWGFIQGNGKFAIEDRPINYGITYDELPFLIVKFANSKQVSDGDPVDLADCSITRNVIAAGATQTTSGFKPILRTPTGLGFPSATNYCYTWIAIGRHDGSYDGDADTLGALPCGTDQIAKFDSTKWICVNIPSADNLGNHTATQNLYMSGYSLDRVGTIRSDDGTGSPTGQPLTLSATGVMYYMSDQDGGGDTTRGHKFFNGTNALANEVMRIGHSGNVGIGYGVINTIHKLDVDGNIAVNGSEVIDSTGQLGWANLKNVPAGLDDGDDLGIKVETDPQVGSNTTNYIPKWNGSALVSSSLYEDASGDVGIGITSPNAKLDVTGGEILADKVRTSNINDYDKLRVLDTPNYAIGINNPIDAGYLGGYAMTFTVYGTSERGWVWRAHDDVPTDGAMSLTTEGKLYVRSTANFNENIGIGTASPAVRLDVKDSSTIGDSNDGPVVVGDWGIQHITLDKEGIQSKYGMAGESDLYFNRFGGDTYISVGGGNVGIGTSGPTEKLEVAGNIQASKFIDRENTSYYVDPSSAISAYFVGSTYTNRVYDINNVDYYLDPNSITTSANLAGDINAYGDISIGSTSAGARLYVNDTGIIGESNDGPVVIGDSLGHHITLDEKRIQAKNGVEAESMLYLNPFGGDTLISGGGDDTFTSMDGGNTYLSDNGNTYTGYFTGDTVLAYGGGSTYTSYGGGDTYLSSGGGSVGVRTTTPATDLHIRQSELTEGGTGGITLDDDDANADEWKIYHSGLNLSFAYNNNRLALIDQAGDYIVASDKRLKKNVGDSGSVLDKISNLSVKKYNYTFQTDTDKKSYGFIAQDVKEIFPEFVSLDENGKYGIAYARFGVVAIKAIQEQQNLIQEQQAKIDFLMGIVCKNYQNMEICK